MSYHYLLDLALILFSTKVLGILTKKIQMPQVVGALLAGLIMGPACLNILAETEFLTQLSELGVIVLMFSAGMGTDIQELKHSGKAGFWVALLGVLFPLAMGTGLAWISGRFGLIHSSGFLEDVFIGTVLTATSVSITVETLKEIGKLDTKVGNTILAAALIDDVLGLIALTIVSSVSGGQESLFVVMGKIVLFFLFAGVVGYGTTRFFCWMMEIEHQQNLRRYPVLAFVLCLVMAYCAEEFFGVADITGAYVAGLVVSCTPKSTYIQSKYEPLSYLLLTPVFFASIGINVQFTGLSGKVMIFAFLLLVISILSKMIGCGLGAKLCHFTSLESLQVGTGMVCRGEVALIVANRGLSLGVLSATMMTPIILTVIGGTILTPVMLKLVFGKETQSSMQESGLADRYDKTEQLDIVSEALLQTDRSYLDKGKSNSKKKA